MNMFESLLDHLKRKETGVKISSTPKGFCPNCWGREEYGGHFYSRLQQENLNVNTKDSNVGWIQAYANKHLAGIVLVRHGNGEDLICPTCQTSYQHDDEHTLLKKS